MPYNIAIDGPAGAGKSTIARLCAEALSFIYVDTGALYRALALYFIEKDIDLLQEEEVRKACQEVRLNLTYQNNEQQVMLNGINIGEKIRREKVGKMASVISAHKIVRERLLELQRQIARDENVVMDGRDIGTCVLPEAQLKIYLTASVSVRAKRRYEQLLLKGTTSNIEEIEKDMIDRDHRDMTREIAPLKQAKDAILLDSSHMSIDEVVQSIIKLYKNGKNK
ncbi:MAG TPA: (d)CMP kinase [Candidatus Merdenecus merdavium]|nr:(d)CMP kinase [Candidatus Merdenecus merdavium]